VIHKRDCLSQSAKVRSSDELPHDNNSGLETPEETMLGAPTQQHSCTCFRTIKPFPDNATDEDAGIESAWAISNFHLVVARLSTHCHPIAGLGAV